MVNSNNREKKKFRIISDKNLYSVKLKNNLIKKLKNISFNKNIFFVIGGDGFMLKTLKKYNKPNKYFYGINSGNYGFLMNKYSEKKIVNNIKKAKMISIYPLEMTVKNKSGHSKKSLAINEVSILRQSKQAASLNINKTSKVLIKNLIADGVLVSTPAGSTAYNLSVHGPILSLNSKKISIAPISAFRPRRWKAKVLSDKQIIFIKNNDIKKDL